MRKEETGYSHPSEKFVDQTIRRKANKEEKREEREKKQTELLKPRPFLLLLLLLSTRSRTNEGVRWSEVEKSKSKQGSLDT